MGFFILSKGTSTARESLQTIARMPAIYALLVGLLLRACHVAVPAPLEETFLSVRGAYTVLGMMMIGLGLAGRRMQEVDVVFLGFTSVAKFVLWPIVMLALLAFDSRFTGFYGADVRPVMLLLSMVPLAANTVAFSTLTNVHPGKAAVAVLISTLLALLMIPFLTGLLLS